MLLFTGLSIRLTGMWYEHELKRHDLTIKDKSHLGILICLFSHRIFPGRKILWRRNLQINCYGLQDPETPDIAISWRCIAPHHTDQTKAYLTHFNRHRSPKPTSKYYTRLSGSVSHLYICIRDIQRLIGAVICSAAVFASCSGGDIHELDWACSLQRGPVEWVSETGARDMYGMLSCE